MNTMNKEYSFLSITVLMQKFVSRDSLQLLLLVLCSLIVNFNTLSNEFVYDDHSQILNNPWITNIKYIPQIFSNDAVFVGNGQVSNYYRPIVRVICMVNYYVFGGIHPWAFHLVNVIFHVGATVLVFLIASVLLQYAKSNSIRSFFSFPFVSALIFAVHPIHSDVVAWAGGVSELSFALFCLLSLYFHMISLNVFDRNHLLSLTFFGVAILCKETAVTLLPLLVLFDYIFRTDEINLRRNILKFAPFVLVVGIYLLLRLNVLGGMAPLSRHPELGTFEVVINVLPLFSQYLEKLLLPLNLNTFYVLHPVHSIIELRWIFSFVIVLAFVALGYVLCKKNKSAFLGLIIITLPLLPALYIRGLGEDTFADRYLYLPSVGFAILAGSLFSIDRIFGVSCKKFLSILLLSLLCVYSIGTINRNKIWHDDLSLWTDTVQKSPDSYFVQQWLGAALLKDKRYDESIYHLQKALQLEPKYDLSYISIAEAYAGTGRRDKAIESLQVCVNISPNSTNCHNNLGCFLLESEMIKESIEEFQIVLKLNPNFENAYNNLGIAYAKLRMKENSVENNTTLKLAPAPP